MFHMKQKYKEKKLLLTKPIPEQEEALIREYLSLLKQENVIQNLVGRAGVRTIWDDHVCDSLALSLLLPEVCRVVDIGSGGGLPAIPLAILNPKSSFSLVDSVKKKTRFLERVAESLSLENVAIFNGRVEHLSRKASGLGALFDVGVAKAVAEARVLLEYFSPLLKVGGNLFLLKGRDYLREVEQAQVAAGKTGFFLSTIFNYPLGEKERYVLHYSKVSVAAVQLPRPVGRAKKNPL